MRIRKFSKATKKARRRGVPINPYARTKPHNNFVPGAGRVNSAYRAVKND